MHERRKFKFIRPLSNDRKFNIPRNIQHDLKEGTLLSGYYLVKIYSIEVDKGNDTTIEKVSFISEFLKPKKFLHVAKKYEEIIQCGKEYLTIGLGISTREIELFINSLQVNETKYEDYAAKKRTNGFTTIPTFEEFFQNAIKKYINMVENG